MSINHRMKQQARNSVPASFRHPRPKAAGTRLGTIEDWREGSGKAGRNPGRMGQSLRDGR